MDDTIYNGIYSYIPSKVDAGEGMLYNGIASMNTNTDYSVGDTENSGISSIYVSYLPPEDEEPTE